ncbi:aminoacyl-tRNA hydrolase [Patescibacteria group bacterium]|nr:aminoacyl-tRNA hydrolase [Patescibacteria group bacterium]
MKLIVGLGNPGKEYQNTRHNVGFLLAEKLVSNLQFSNFKLEKKFNAKISAGLHNGSKIVIAKPQTFMNESGLAVRAISDFFKLAPSDIIVVHDDKDIALGEYKIQTDRGSAGHNGVKSIIEHLGTQNFTRVRIGVAPETREIDDTADFVLGKLGKEEKKVLDEVLDKAINDLVGLE